MKKKANSKPNLAHRAAIIILKLLIGLLILVGVGLPVYLMIWAAPSPPEIQTLEADVNRLWIEQIESDTGGSHIRRIEFKPHQGAKFVCTLAPMAMQLWGQLDVGETYQIEVTRAGRRCYLHDAKPFGTGSG
jgi:hypothetical protein